MPYHVMSRGNGKQRIFITCGDRSRFLVLLAETTQRFDVACHGYCLMANHYHLTLRPGPQPVSRMMQQLNSSYADYFNWKHRRVGHVLEGRFKGLLVEGDDYFLRLLRYMVRNPVEARIVKTPDAWRWSSYRATAGLEPVPPFLSLDPVWSMFDGADRARAQQQFAAFAAIPEDTAPFLSALFFGSDRFGRGLSSKLEPTRHVSEYTYAHRYADRPPLRELLRGNQTDLQRVRAMQEAFARHAYTLREIGEVIGCHPSTVWRQIRRLPATEAFVAYVERLRGGCSTAGAAAARPRRESRSDPTLQRVTPRRKNQDLTPRRKVWRRRAKIKI